jgi:hypothetical protein
MLREMLVEERGDPNPILIRRALSQMRGGGVEIAFLLQSCAAPIVRPVFGRLLLANYNRPDLLIWGDPVKRYVQPGCGDAVNG